MLTRGRGAGCTTLPSLRGDLGRNKLGLMTFALSVLAVSTLGGYPGLEPIKSDETLVGVLILAFAIFLLSA